MNNLWKKIATFLAKIMGVKTIPPEVVNSDSLIHDWWDIFRCKAPWLPYTYVTSDGCQRKHTRFSLNLAKMSCAELAGLVLSETPEVQASSTVLEVIERENFWENLRRSTEYQAALGGQALKIYRENDVIHIDFVKAMNFVPLTWDNANVVEASFVDRRVSGDSAYIRVETHRKTEGGYEIRSEAFDEKTGLSASLSIMWPGVEPSVIVQTDYPLFVYARNPEANNIDPESPLGISVYANAIDTLKSIDMAFDEFHWEIECGQRRIALPGTAMRGYMDAETGKRRLGFNPGDRVFLRLEGDDIEKFKPTDLTTDIREQSFINTINYLLNIYAMQIGFSSGYFSFDGKSMKTATEVVSENSTTYKTVQGFKDVLDEKIKQLFKAIDSVSGLPETDIEIQWNDSIVEDAATTAKYHQDLVLAGLEDQVSAIMAVHGITLEAAQEMYEKIKAEKAIAMPAFPGV